MTRLAFLAFFLAPFASKKRHYSGCPVCSSGEVYRRGSLIDGDFYMEVIVCGECGTVYKVIDK